MIFTGKYGNMNFKIKITFHHHCVSIRLLPLLLFLSFFVLSLRVTWNHVWNDPVSSFKF